LNTDSIQEVQSLVALLLRYVAQNGMLVCIEHTNLSGIFDRESTRSNRTWDELHQYVFDSNYSSDVFLTHFLGVARFGKLALTPFVTKMLRLLHRKQQWMAIHRIQRRRETI